MSDKEELVHIKIFNETGAELCTALKANIKKGSLVMLFIDDNDWILNTLQYHIPMMYKEIASELITYSNENRKKMKYK